MAAQELPLSCEDLDVVILINYVHIPGAVSGSFTSIGEPSF